MNVREEDIMPKLLISILPAVIGVALLPGCASKSQQASTVDWDHGAKHGWVVARYAPDASGSALPPCLASLPETEYVKHRYAKLRYRQGHHTHDVVAELPPGLPLNDGQPVELWPADCAAGQLAHISRILAATAQAND